MSLNEIIKDLIETEGLIFKTSFGNFNDSIDVYYKIKKNGIWIRLAVGYNDLNDYDIGNVGLSDKILGLFKESVVSHVPLYFQ